ncbi:hypothetical protein Flavo103_41570 [Flavobacterium collinsii]|uniref:porin n=1 Tax=Flavobacterium collinsii TaxID=1114861 RepID=UPI0022BC7279|nr:porin [Flavobacterium collinsii]GIQ61021.1 hypothetical protein Flavo103_41570 [Flavobacterium collinsii]
MFSRYKIFIRFKVNLIVYFILNLLPVSAQQINDTAKVLTFLHFGEGIQFKTGNNKFLLHLSARFQFRFASPNDQNPVTYDDYNLDRQLIFKTNRARLKAEGHAFQSWIKYSSDYDLRRSLFLDYKIMIEKWEWLNFKAGQWKIEFNRERFISSGEQQMVDRSIINRHFTVDRQQGIEIYGHLMGNGIADFNYWAAILTGTGIGGKPNQDNRLMYFGRAQWNFLGRVLDYEGSDLAFHEMPAGSVAYSFVTNCSPYTRFSQVGGGSLIGYFNGAPGQYRVNQWNYEAAFKYRRFSFQSEWHTKIIIDHLNGNKEVTLKGYYGQAGYFFNDIINWWPRKLEVAGRFALYRPDNSIRNNLQNETAVTFNWFFNGHKNKLTSEVTYFTFQDKNLPLAAGWRFILQWDISL